MADAIVISCRLCPGCWRVIPDGRCVECRKAESAKYREKMRRRGNYPTAKRNHRKIDRKPKADITAEDVRRLLSYDPRTGDFSRRGKRQVLGSLNAGGYVMVSVLGWTFRAHRLAWLYVHGRHPTSKLDHINGSRIDNRIDNLREVTDAVNCQNLRAPKSHNRSGYLGVLRCPKTSKWIARITVAGKVTVLGRFDAPEAASAAYIEAKRLMHEGCTL